MSLGTRVGGVYYEAELSTATAVQEADQLASTIKRTGDQAEQAFGAQTQRGLSATAEGLAHASTTGRETIRVVDALTNRFQVFGPDGPIVRDLSEFGVHFAKLTGHLGDDSAIVQAVGKAGSLAGGIYTAAFTGAANLGAGLSLIWGEAASAGSVVGAVKAAGVATGQLYGTSLLSGLTAGLVVAGAAAIGNQITDAIQKAVGPDSGLGQSLQVTQNNLFFGQLFGQESNQEMIARISAAASAQAETYALKFVDVAHRDMDKNLPDAVELAARHAADRAKEILSAQAIVDDATRRWGQVWEDDRVSRMAAAGGARDGKAYIDAATASIDKGLEQALQRWRGLGTAANRDQGGVFDWSAFLPTRSASVPTTDPRR